MAKSARINALEAGIREIVEPELERRGFRFTAKLRQFSRPSGSCQQLIEFQIGLRAAEGTFTVNLAIYHPVYHHPAARSGPPRESDCLFEFRRRLGTLRESRRTRLFRRLLAGRERWLARRLTSTSDRWWRFSADADVVRRSLTDVVRLLDERGLPWLDDHADEERLRTAHARWVPDA